MESLGNEVRRDGQETLTLREGTVRVDRTSYPVVYNPKLQQRIILDPEEKIPDSLKSKLTDPSVYTAVFPVTRTSSLQESVNQLLSRLGYQSLPTDRPVVIQEAGISIEARGNWMALAPQENNKAQDIFVIALTDNPQDIPDYLRKELSNRGLHFKDILLAASSEPITGRRCVEGVHATGKIMAARKERICRCYVIELQRAFRCFRNAFH